MDNISIEGENLFLRPGVYYIMDALYLNSIKSDLDNLDTTQLDKEIREKIFPYMRTPFAKIALNKGLFEVQAIRKIKDGETLSGDEHCFSNDTGLILLIEKSLLIPFMKDYNFGDLVESLTDVINLEYWHRIIDGVDPNFVGLILAPGIDSGYEFEGGGTYKVYN